MMNDRTVIQLDSPYIHKMNRKATISGRLLTESKYKEAMATKSPLALAFQLPGAGNRQTGAQARAPPGWLLTLSQRETGGQVDRVYTVRLSRWKSPLKMLPTSHENLQVLVLV
jgi:hypothetical protein